MSDSRISGALLLILSTLAFLASTRELLPAVSVFPALLLFAIGAIQLLRGQRQADRRVRPPDRPARATQGSADRASVSSARHDLALAERRALRSPASSAPTPSPTTPTRAANAATSLPEIELEEAVWDATSDSEKKDEDASFLVSGDVSFPIEVQRGDALADELRKLSLLLEQGVLSEAEYAMAKAKLLS